jgi:hypothetical protein
MHGRHGLCEHLVVKARNAGTPQPAPWLTTIRGDADTALDGVRLRLEILTHTARTSAVLIDGEVVICGEDGIPVFDRLRYGLAAPQSYTMFSTGSP